MGLDPLGSAVLLIVFTVDLVLHFLNHGLDQVALPLLIQPLTVLLLKPVELRRILFVFFPSLGNFLMLLSHILIIRIQVGLVVVVGILMA